MEEYLFTCTICGRKKAYPVSEMVEGAKLSCPFCKVVITLHGHQLQEVEADLKAMKNK